jgi:RimJ/RimL family protein N-acetyltransferase
MNNRHNKEELIITYKKLTEPDPEILNILNQWENDPLLTPFIRPNRNKEELEAQVFMSLESFNKRLDHHPVFLIYADGRLVGEMDFQIDPDHLYKKITGTAWIGINIGESTARGKGIGTQAMQYLEDQINNQGLNRIELGVFEFNVKAINLYRRMGYQEIGRIDDFTYWQGKLWQDIRMEKYL